MAKYPQWEYDLLQSLGAPAPLTPAGMDAQFPNALEALNLWAQSEGSVTNNPLATSGKGPGATKCVAQCGSSSPIYEYDTVSDGVAQMAKFLQGSNYTRIVKALVGNADLASIYQAINGSKWCAGCQSGHYPVDLFTAVGGGSAAISGTVGTGTSAGASSAPNQPGNDLSTCVISFPGFLFFSGPCLLTKGGVKWLSGVVALGAGVVVAGFGVVLLASAVGKSTGATAAVKKAAGALPGPTGKIVRGTSSASSAPSPARRSAPSSRPTPAASSEPKTAGRIESRRIDRRYEDAQRQQGPIGPRGGNPTATRIASRERRGTSVPGARRQPANRPGGQPF